MKSRWLSGKEAAHSSMNGDNVPHLPSRQAQRNGRACRLLDSDEVSCMTDAELMIEGDIPAGSAAVRGRWTTGINRRPCSFP